MITDDKYYPAAGEDKVWGRFEWFKQLDIAASKEKDEEIYRDIVTIRIKAANSEGESVLPIRPFNKDTMIKRFPDAWRAFNGEKMDPGGTSLDVLHLDERDRALLTLYGIHNADMLAALSDEGARALGFGWLKRRDEAKGLLQARKDDHLAAMLKKVEEMTAEPKRKAGRPKKSDAVQTAA